MSRVSLPPVGTRIRLVAMLDDPDPIPPGSKGTVIGGNPGVQVFVAWDNGRSLNLLPDVDQWEVIDE